MMNFRRRLKRKRAVKTFNIGIIGDGTVAQTHIRALSFLDNVHIAAVCDVKSPEKINIPDGAVYYSDYKKMIEEQKLDAVHICLPHYLHLPVASYCASKHVPVLCEKPVAMNYREVEEMEGLQDKYGVTVAVCLQNRWNNTFRTLQSVVESGKDGRLTGLKAVALWARDQAYYDRAPWRGRMEYAGGGCLINQAVHTLDQVLLLGGKAKSVKGIVTNVLDLDIEVEDSSVSEVVFENGVRALIMASNANTVNSTIELEAVFENAVYTIKDYKLYRAPADDTLAKSVIAEDELMPGAKSYYGAGHKVLIKDFYDYLGGDGGRVISVKEAGTVIKLIDTIRESSRTGKTIEWR